MGVLDGCSNGSGVVDVVERFEDLTANVELSQHSDSIVRQCSPQTSYTDKHQSHYKTSYTDKRM